MGAAFESYRTRAAKLAAAGDALKRRSGAPAPFSLVFMTDAQRAPRPELIVRALPPGAGVILRDYRSPRRRALAQRLAALCRARGVKFLVGTDVSLARAVGADGVHWPRWADPTPRAALAGLIVTAACHDEGELERAARIGADAAILSPVFPTGSHPDSETLGARRFAQLARNARLPVLALGGVDETNARQLAGANVAGIAAISAFLAD